MHSCIFWDNIREIEFQLYGGPETYEHSFESDDSFHSDRLRRRGTSSDSVSNDNNSEESVWYTIEIDPDTGILKYTM